jgi:RNA polymerase sigma factor (sigma-70 family)
MVMNEIRTFDETFRAEYSLVTAFAMRHVGATNSDDVASETFATVWARWDDAPGHNREILHYWVMSIAKNHILHYRRSIARQVRLSSKVTLNFRPTDGEVSSPEMMYLAKYDGIYAFQSLPANEKLALTLTALGYAHREAAQVIHCPLSTVSNRVARARRAVAKLNLM